MTLGADGNLYAAAGKGIYRSSNVGTSWILTDQTTQQDNTIKPLLLQPAHCGGRGFRRRRQGRHPVAQFCLGPELPLPDERHRDQAE